jgi:hypothetical protein
MSFYSLDKHHRTAHLRCIDSSITQALAEPSKLELRLMLARAALETSKLPKPSIHPVPIGEGEV